MSNTLSEQVAELEAALDQIRERAEKATEGPWEVEGSLIGGRRYAVGQAFGIKWRDDLPFIAHARTDIPRLVAAIEAALKEADDADQQDRLISPAILRKRITDKLTGADDE